MDSLPAFARVLKQRQMKTDQTIDEKDSYRVSNKDYSQYDSDSQISILEDSVSNIPAKKQKKNKNIDIDIESCLRSVSEMESTDQLYELQKMIKKLEQENSTLRKENRQIVEYKQQIEIEREVSTHYSDSLHETQNLLESERQINENLKERVAQLEQILAGKESMTEAKTSMAMKLQEEYDHVTKDYQRILDLYNKMVVQLREARNRISELEAELDNSKNNSFGKDNISKKNTYEPFNYEDYMRPKTNTKYFDDFNDFGKPFEQQSDIPAIKPYVPPNSYDPPQIPVEQKRDFNDNFVEQQKSPPNQTLQPKKAALVDNIHFGVPEPTDTDDFDVSGMSKFELENLLSSLQAEKMETERILALAPKQGISKSRVLREKEELADKADLLEKKIAKVKREMRKL
ncbi:hypothetical protein TVAG_382480 [Trichomonas vaginalis G3]|uniref:Uncharacterized protein n=1 Tax=Trichomonas vaginalis (strain ATCC PRA-98 / G3) TaxID=412133 RepID=A2FBS4_TRIV3|nr:nucleotidyltransferases domain 2 domain-containing protein [Trichomonas vaginalis G3]EAX97624.1 hypothetical protein TVAG_382480 [Trichomonas vaginalis G3]KAI5505301.1 nucleotidyltransferases domain 2 domain-containing protein [Trichomonas vaginalis G3]|eukprot:XP_001310554.1 hypothetical protein [Trichomonas vaginalis G3]